jgi:hypothetical protein
MNKKILYIGILVFIMAGINVKLNNSTYFGGSLSLSNIEALGDGECESCNFSLVPTYCYDSVCLNVHSPHIEQHCGVYGDLCPAAYKRGYGSGPLHSCILRVDN